MNGRKLTVLTAIAGILALGEFGSAAMIGLGEVGPGHSGWAFAAAARRPGGRLPRRPAHHDPVRPGPRQPGPARHVYRRGLHRWRRPVTTPPDRAPPGGCRCQADLQRPMITAARPSQIRDLIVNRNRRSAFCVVSCRAGPAGPARHPGQPPPRSLRMQDHARCIRKAAMSHSAALSRPCPSAANRGGRGETDENRGGWRDGRCRALDGGCVARRWSRGDRDRPVGRC